MHFHIPSLSSWGARHKLIFKAFVMCALCYSLRFNLSLAIVAMVDDDETHSASSTDMAINHSGKLQDDICPSLMEHHVNESVFIYVNSTSDGDNPRILNMTADESIKASKTFRWNEKDQGLILGSFFWGYMVTQFPAGLLAYKFGGKWVAGLGMIWTALFSLALPQAAAVGGRDLVVLVRVLQGFSSGFVIPALVVILAKWSPPEERARLSAVCCAGLPLGTALTMILSGYLIPAFGWPSVFYMPGLLTIIWFIWWSCTVYSSPEEDPSISPEELKYLESCSGVTTEHDSSESTKLSEVPWREIITSGPMWAVFTSQFCGAWGHNMLKSEGPKYLHSALHFDIHQNSYLSAMPYICQFIFMMLVGRLSDYLIERKVLSILNARKLCNSVGQWGTALCFAGLIAAGCSRTAAVFFYILSGMVNGASVSGSCVNVIDISPRYAGTIEGAINGAANVAGFGAPYLAGLILFHEPSLIGWNCVFLVPVITNVVGNFVFIFGASDKVQSWNDHRTKCHKNTHENKNNS